MSGKNLTSGLSTLVSHIETGLGGFDFSGDNSSAELVWIPEWPFTRGVGFDEAECDPERLIPVPFRSSMFSLMTFPTC